MKVGVIIVAAGLGSRLGQPRPKAFVSLKGRLLYQYSLSVLATHSEIKEGVLVVPEALGTIQAKPFKVVPGGASRQQSVALGLEALSPDCEGVLVHDAARPFISTRLIDRLLARLKQRQNAIPVLPIVDTVKWVEGEKVVKTVDRQQLGAAQTPQGCLVSDLKRALAQAWTENWQATDEAALLERIGVSVFTVEGEANNIKITTPADWRKAEFILEEQGCE